MAESSVLAPMDFKTSSTLSSSSSSPFAPLPLITVSPQQQPPASAAKSILKRRFSSTEDSSEETSKDPSLWFEGKKLRFGSESAPSPSSSTAPVEAESHHQGDQIMEDVEVFESVGLNEETRKQMALMGREGKGVGRKKVIKGAKEANDQRTLDHPGPEVVAEVAGLKDSLSRLERFTKDSEEWSDILRPLLGPPPSSNSNSRRPSFNSETSSPNSSSSSDDLLDSESPSRPTIPSLPEILSSPLLGPHFPPVLDSFESAARRQTSAPDPVSRSSAAAVTLASFAANPTTHRGISPAPFSPSSSSYLLAKATANSAPSTPLPFADPSLHLAPIRPPTFSLPATPVPYTRSNLSGSLPPEARRPSLMNSSKQHAISLPNVPTRRTSTTDGGPSASHLLNQLRRHSNPASTFSGQPRKGSISGPGGGGGGAKELLRRYSTIVREKLETWEGLESLVKDAEEVREDWDQGMAKVM